MARIGSKDKSVGWYDKALDKVPDDAAELLVHYAHIPADGVLEYVLEIRDKAWDIHPYPCIGQFRFLNLSLYRQPSYPSLLEKMKSGATLLDIGCCLGQDLRKLVLDGAVPENVYGAELEGEFINLGYELWRDKDTLKATLMQADIFDTEGPLQALQGRMDIIHLGMILHVFTREMQFELLKTCIALLKPEPGSLILGQAVGNVQGGLTATNLDSGSFQHNEDTFFGLWGELQAGSGLKFDVRPSLDKGLGIDENKRKWGLPGARRLRFEVEIV
ncbi:hypothetical protein GQ53DRAFT_877743 [Thozetella sp. PMI_491]|nr:hypothetical protein GQ53DRAFT_877743 [Thozetella sp. PMI_491]